MTVFGTPIDTRPLFPRDRAALLDLLDGLSAKDWARPTVCPGWDVHDVLAHIVDDHVRRLSAGRDGHRGVPFADGETVPGYVARINDEFVRAMRRVSPRVLVDLLAVSGPRLDAYWATVRLDGPAGLDVSWAAQDLRSPAWLDVAREYTELWVHQQQIRDAVGRPGGDGPALLGPVVDTFLRALPKALDGCARPVGTCVRFDVTGPAGGSWAAVRGPERWAPAAADDAAGGCAARVTTDQDTLWRLASRGITPEQARDRSTLSGDDALAHAATALLAVVA